MDGVLSDFASAEIAILNEKYNKSYTLDQTVNEQWGWNTWSHYGITESDFWDAIGEDSSFWVNIKPISWYKELYAELSKLGEVTILTSPAYTDKDCARQKLEWLEQYLGIKPGSVMIGHRKHLLAGNGILIDDYFKNVEKFKENGGEAILIPSTWNTPDLTFEIVWEIIIKGLIECKNNSKQRTLVLV